MEVFYLNPDTKNRNSGFKIYLLLFLQKISAFFLMFVYQKQIILNKVVMRIAI